MPEEAMGSYYYYCVAHRIIMSALPDGVTSSDVGTLEGTSSIDCDGVQQSPPAQAAPASPPPAGPDDCTCNCCHVVQCPIMTVGTFYAGSSNMCTASACRSHFYFCPDQGTHSNGGQVKAMFGVNNPSALTQSYEVAGSVYVPFNNVNDAFTTASVTCPIKEALKASNWAGAKASYEQSLQVLSIGRLS